MAAPAQPASDAQIEAIYRQESRRVFATLVRLIGDFDAAEEALHEAFKAALEQWRREGLPANPRAWLVSAGRFKAIDKFRREARFEALPEDAEERFAAPAPEETQELEDDRLRLIFTCCHPALSLEAQVALTLREICGLSTEAIASAFLTPVATLAQRIVRAKTKIKNTRIPYRVPELEELPERLDAVLRVIYLVFNEGYAASSGDALTRHDLSDEAIRLCRLLVELLPRPEALSLLALMLLHESRRHTRTDAQGDLVLLEEQDRGLWNRALIEEGTALVRQAAVSGQRGTYLLQAAIAAAHANAASYGETPWEEIVRYYDALLALERSPIVALNRAVAIAMKDGAEAGLALVNQLLAEGELADYHLAHAARADLRRRLGDVAGARDDYERALSLAKQAPERRFIERRLRELPI